MKDILNPTVKNFFASLIINLIKIILKIIFRSFETWKEALIMPADQFLIEKKAFNLTKIVSMVFWYH
mgnify:CR=1 FL=1